MGHLVCPIKKQTSKQAAKGKRLRGTVTKTQLITGLSSPLQKAQAESGKRSLPTEKELSSRHLCLHTTDHSYAQDSANLQQYVLLRNNLVTEVVIHATVSFNLHCNNVADKLKKNAARITGPICPIFLHRSYLVFATENSPVIMNKIEEKYRT